ncbi:hypothetical protein EGJ50_10125 [Pseudomonas luteola]|nr:hypothetical protein EGJ50_10125 [Pseudomonas luteola]
MPYELAMSSELSRRQFHGIAQSMQSDHDKRVAELEAEIKRLTGFVVQRRKMCDDYDKALEEVASQMHAFKAELATEKARADAAVGDANEAEAELAEAVELIKQAKPLVDLLFYGGSMDRQSGERVKELFHMFARHGDKS